MKCRWINVSEALPPEGQYVLIHLVKDNWKDSTDPKGVYYTVAKLKKGLTPEDRSRMQSGELPDPKEESWCLSEGWTQHRRSAVHKGEDQYGNNEVPYVWRNFGPGDYFGQEVDFWMEIPPLPTTEG